MPRTRVDRVSFARSSITAAVLGPLFALPLAAAAEVRPLAEVDAGGNVFSVRPLVAYDAVRLTVSGPGGFEVVRSFSGEEVPTIQLPGIDGLYKYELRFAPALGEEERKRLAAARARGADSPIAIERENDDTVQSGAFTVLHGSVMSGQLEPEQRLVVTNADGVVRNSLCVGFDCPDAPVFSDSTILLMENNTRIKFGDTSAAGFPHNDWEIEANSGLAGGLSYLGFNDCGPSDNDGGCADDPVFAVEAGARRSALWVEADGDVGIGTSNPFVDIHLVTGNTPTLRLDQDGSSGFTPQIWDVAGNETNFFIRDVNNGSMLPLRIRPGAPTSSIDVASNGNVGIGTGSPLDRLHIHSSGTVPAAVRYTNGDSLDDWWQFGLNPSEDFVINFRGDALAELKISKAGGLFVAGPGLTADYVFAPEYSLMPLGELEEFVRENRRLPNIKSAEEVEAEGLELARLTVQLLEKIEELTLYTLQQQAAIDRQQGALEELQRQREELASRLAAVEQR